MAIDIDGIAKLLSGAEISAAMRIKDLDGRTRAFLEIIEERNERIRGLVAEICADPVWIPHDWGLTRSERIVLMSLYTRHGIVSRDKIFTDLYFIQPLHIRDEPGTTKVIDVFIHKIRAKLALLALPIEIETVWGIGVRLTDASKEYLRGIEARSRGSGRRPAPEGGGDVLPQA